MDEFSRLLQPLKQQCETKICEKGGSGNILPLFKDSEQDWPRGVRIVLYLLGLIWTFMGVAIVSEVFMGAIERITSKRKRVVDPMTGRNITMKVWNDTVANLTLMALGSSAPEILLSVIELCTGDMFSGELGPSTIVGSAAFNLFCISAVCVVTIPEGEIRKIKDVSVFAVTACFSIFAYLWLYFIVVVSSEDVIHIWEAALTFAMFPLLVALAFYADRGGLSSTSTREAATHRRVTVNEMSKEEVARLEVKILQRHGQELDDQALAKLMAKENGAQKSRAAYRVEATRKMVGGQRLPALMAGTTVQHQSSVVVPMSRTMTLPKDDVFIEFCSDTYAVIESIGILKISVKRTGLLEPVTRVDYCTRDGTALAKSDYEPAKGTLEFAHGEEEKIIQIKIVDDDAYEEDEEFYVDLTNARCTDMNYSATIGRKNKATVAIVDDDEPGILLFSEDVLHVTEDVEDKVVPVTVRRKLGSRGKITCKYRTEDATATAGHDFLPVSGTLELLDGCTSGTIEITICALGRYDDTEEFRLILSHPTGGASFDADTDGGADECILTIIIESDETNKGRIDTLMQVLQWDWDKAQIGHSNWKDQFRCALLVNGGEQDEDTGLVDKIMHYITLFWKVLFACIPPTDFCGGWACFIVALAMIGGVTAIIGDLANLLGCVMDIPGSITAITFVALGTSLPDTFASKNAAEQDPYADASIGNVTGSNSVNVFLGLGMPWLLGAVYWQWQDFDSSAGREWASKYPDMDFNRKTRFIVKGGDLGFSVIIFSICSIGCIGTLILRRRTLGGELGGPYAPKLGTAIFFVALWFTYIGMSIWKVYDDPGPCL